MAQEPIDTDQLIRDAYAIVADPERLFDLQLRMERAQRESTDELQELAKHLDQVGELFDTIHLGPEADYSGMGLVPVYHEDQTGATSPFVVLDTSLRVIEVRSVDWLAEPPTAGEALPEWMFGIDLTLPHRLRDAIDNDANGEARYFRLYAGPDDDRGFLAIAATSTQAKERRLELSRIGLEWDARIGARFADVMGLSEAETALAAFIVSGRSVNDFAAERGRSVGTARNQLKAISRKLGIGSQNELISLYAGFANSLSLQELAKPAVATSQSEHQVILPDGSAMRFERFGRAGGRPVIFLHSAINGPFLQAKVEHAARRVSLDIYVPWMPFYSDADRTGTTEATIEDFAAKIDGFCETLGIERCALLACSISCAYAFAAAALFPQRFSGLAAFALALPVDANEGRDGIHPIWRAPLAMGRKAPVAVELLVKSIVKLLMRGEGHRYVERLLGGSEVDRETLRHPEFEATVRKGLMQRPDKGHRAMAHGLLVQALDWSKWIEAIEIPVRVIIAELDSLHSPAAQVVFCERHGFEIVGPVSGVGGFTLFQDPELVFAQIDAMPDIA